MKRIFAVVFMSASLLVSGCASNMTSHDYTPESSRQKMKVELGVVESVRSVKINGKASPVGGMAGGALGALAGGSGGGGGLGQLAVMVTAGVVGAVIGSMADKKLHDADGTEITILLANSNELLAVTQAVDEKEPFVKGDSVRVITTASGSSRVSH